MSELVWPAVVVFCAVLLFIRTKPRAAPPPPVDLGLLDARFAKLETAAGEQTPKAIVDRLNIVSKEMTEIIKPRLLAVEETAAEAKRTAGKLMAVHSSKVITGSAKPIE